MTKADMRKNRISTILAATKKLLLQDGIGSGLMSSIARESGISRQRLYQYFFNLDDVLVALLVEMISEIYDGEYELIKKYRDVKSPTEALRLCLRAILEHLCSDDEHIQDTLLALNLVDIYTTKNTSMLKRDLLDGIDRAPENLMCEILFRGQIAGEFRTDISATGLEYFARELMLGYAYRTCAVRTDAKFSVMKSSDVYDWIVESIVNYMRAPGK